MSEVLKVGQYFKVQDVGMGGVPLTYYGIILGDITKSKSNPYTHTFRGKVLCHSNPEVSVPFIHIFCNNGRYFTLVSRAELVLFGASYE